MRHIKTYNEAVNKPFVEKVEYIKDICLDLKDDGFEVDVKRESYWKSDNKNIGNRFSPSHQHEPNSVKLLMIRVVIYKVDASSPAYPFSREKFNPVLVKDTFNRIVNYLNDDLILNANDDVPLMRAFYGPSIMWKKNTIQEIDEFDKSVDKIEFNLHIKR